MSTVRETITEKARFRSLNTCFVVQRCAAAALTSIAFGIGREDFLKAAEMAFDAQLGIIEDSAKEAGEEFEAALPAPELTPEEIKQFMQPLVRCIDAGWLTVDIAEALGRKHPGQVLEWLAGKEIPRNTSERAILIDTFKTLARSPKR